MASNEDNSPSPDRMETVEGDHIDSNGEGTHLNELNPDHQYSPTSPTEDSPVGVSQVPGDASGGEYSPTFPTGDADDLEYIFGSTQGSQPEELVEPGDDLASSTDEANAASVQEMDHEDSADSHDMDTYNRLVMHEEGEDKLSAVDKDEDEKAEADLSQGLVGSQEPQFEISETFLDNMNPQDDSQDPEDVQDEERDDQFGREQIDEDIADEQSSAQISPEAKPGEMLYEEDKEEACHVQENERHTPEDRESSEVSVSQDKQDLCEAEEEASSNQVDNRNVQEEEEEHVLLEKGREDLGMAAPGDEAGNNTSG